jgi:predicted amidohydrolase
VIVPLNIGLIQFRSGPQLESNLAQIEHLLNHLSHESPDVLLLPDHCLYLNKLSSFRSQAYPIETHPWIPLIQVWAQESGSVVVSGTIPEQHPTDPTKIYQTAVIAFPDREPMFVRKRCLFRGVVGEKLVDESQFVSPGREGLVSFSLNGWKLGVTLCTELRYSHIFQELRYDHHCDLVCIPSSVYVSTGSEHWFPLLKSRAIEFQMYVAAANQSALPEESPPVFCGQSAIIDPWGNPMSLANTYGEALCFQEIFKESLLSTRVKIDTSINVRSLR